MPLAASPSRKEIADARSLPRSSWPVGLLSIQRPRISRLLASHLGSRPGVGVTKPDRIPLASSGKGGLERAVTLDVIGRSVVASPLIGSKCDAILEGSYEPAVTVEQMIDDFDLLIDTAWNDHAPTFAAALLVSNTKKSSCAATGRRTLVLCARP